jgi:hypothetical protein
MVPALPLGYVSGDDDFSLDAGESKTVSFKPGVKTDWSVDTKKERCGNDSLMVIIKTETSLDTLRSWKPNQNLPNGAYYGLTMIALAPMDSIKLKIRQRNG